MSEQRAEPAWWALHLRRARGESLSPAEQVAYEAGCRTLEQGDITPGDIEKLRELRTELLRLNAECEKLKAQSAELDRQIADLEAKIPPHIWRQIAVDDTSAEVTRLSEEAVREVDQWERQE